MNHKLTNILLLCIAVILCIDFFTDLSHFNKNEKTNQSTLSLLDGKLDQFMQQPIRSLSSGSEQPQYSYQWHIRYIGENHKDVDEWVNETIKEMTEKGWKVHTFGEADRSSGTGYYRTVSFVYILFEK